jgi:hypothetical protein
VACKFQTGNNKIKVISEYELLTQFYLATLCSLDFFLWGYGKDIVYKTPVTSLHELKVRIVAAIKTVSPQMLEST